MRQCAICGKHPFNGSQVTHRGMLKKAGGVGRRTVRVNPRRFLPNLQRATIILSGTVTHAVVRRRCVDEMGDEREKRRQPRETVARGNLLDQGEREGGDVGIAREGEGELVEDRTRVLGLWARRAQRGFSSNSSRLMISASSLSFRHFA